jgi:hypothetical protein
MDGRLMLLQGHQTAIHAGPWTLDPGPRTPDPGPARPPNRTPGDRPVFTSAEDAPAADRLVIISEFLIIEFSVTRSSLTAPADGKTPIQVQVSADSPAI